VLLKVADGESADLIVLGRRGAGGASELVLGSTSLQVTAEAGVPVLVVPSRGATDARAHP
jgi:nucleotide-binding universal stress UspA family protein